MAVSPDGSIAITTSETTNMAHWIDTEKQAIFANSLVEQRPRHAEFTADGEQLWVSSEIGGVVSVFDTADQTELGQISFEISGITEDKIQPVGIRITRDRSRAFVALGPSNHVAVVNAQTFEVEEYLLVGRRVWHLELTADEKLLFTTNGISGDVTVVDTERLEPVKTVKVGRFPWGAAYRP
jgi:PQQ-dependent catabolism-associated beta-propeller protein